jgi:hypothetical protein
MFKFISYLLIVSLTTFPLAYASDTPFYLKDKSPLPPPNVAATTELYKPGKMPYADWLIKRAYGVAAKLSNCFDELAKYSNARTNRELTDRNWVLVKIQKKTDYIKFLNEKFEQNTGTKMIDAGYAFSYIPDPLKNIAEVAEQNKTEIGVEPKSVANLDDQVAAPVVQEVEQPKQTEVEKKDLTKEQQEAFIDEVQNHGIFNIILFGPSGSSDEDSAPAPAAYLSPVQPQATKQDIEPTANDSKEVQLDSVSGDKNAEQQNPAPVKEHPATDIKKEEAKNSNESSDEDQVLAVQSTSSLSELQDSNKNPVVAEPVKVEAPVAKLEEPKEEIPQTADLPEIQEDKTAKTFSAIEPGSDASLLTSVNQSAEDLLPAAPVKSEPIVEKTEEKKEVPLTAPVEASSNAAAKVAVVQTESNPQPNMVIDSKNKVDIESNFTPTVNSTPVATILPEQIVVKDDVAQPEVESKKEQIVASSDQPQANIEAVVPKVESSPVVEPSPTASENQAQVKEMLPEVAAFPSPAVSASETPVPVVSVQPTADVPAVVASPLATASASPTPEVKASESPVMSPSPVASIEPKPLPSISVSPSPSPSVMVEIKKIEIPPTAPISDLVIAPSPKPSESPAAAALPKKAVDSELDLLGEERRKIDLLMDAKKKSKHQDQVKSTNEEVKKEEVIAPKQVEAIHHPDKIMEDSPIEEANGPSF